MSWKRGIWKKSMVSLKNIFRATEGRARVKRVKGQEVESYARGRVCECVYLSQTFLVYTGDSSATHL